MNFQESKLQRVGVAADHGGFELKEQLVEKLRVNGREVVDFGDRRRDPDDDYPDFAPKATYSSAGGLGQQKLEFKEMVRAFRFDLASILGRDGTGLMFNASTVAVDFGLPRVPPGTRWHLAVDTSREAPQDLFAAGEEPLRENPQTYHLGPRSSAILLARGTDGQTRQTPLTEAK